MIKYNPVTGESGNCFVVGRGAIAIRLALSAIPTCRGKVIVPANICYAAVLPIIYAGLEPSFCDVDPVSGNVTFKMVEQSLQIDTVAAIIPHMYGNPVYGFLQIAELLKSRGVLLIEDCASLMAIDGEHYTPGTIGDYVIYSTGYSKTVDIGIGGLLFSKENNLREMEITEKKFHPYKSEYENTWNDFSGLYRKLRNIGERTLEAKRVFAYLPELFRDSFHFSVDDAIRRRVIESMTSLDGVIQERRRQCRLYRELLDMRAERQYTYYADAVPWRFNMYVGDERKEFIEWCLNHRLPVSDWYPLVTPIFDDDGFFPGAEEHGKHIINFPLMIPDERIIEICKAINDYYKGV